MSKKAGGSSYSVVGGNPFTGYTKTTTFTSLRVLGVGLSKSEAKKCVKDNYEDCCGLILAFDEEGNDLQ